MFTGSQFEGALRELGVTHVVWVPDSTTGLCEESLEKTSAVQLVRVCREGEAWAVASGLQMEGRQPLIVIQNTGLFESGDALHNVLFELKLPLYALIGYRNYLIEKSSDTARQFTEPFLAAYGLDPVLLEGSEALSNFAEHYRHCQST